MQKRKESNGRARSYFCFEKDNEEGLLFRANLPVKWHNPLKQFLLVGLVVLLVLSGVLPAKAFKLSDGAEISLITCDPGFGAATVYGHSAIRVKDAAYDYDLAFNYGIYDFESPNFLYRFASGQTDYLLAAYNFDAFVNSYKNTKRSVYEQLLDLTPAEKQKIFDFLVWNAKPENRIYRYNFFFDNCATRVRDVLVNNIEGGLIFNEEERSGKTLRGLVKDCHGKLLWLSFGIDYVVSSKSDREATYWEEMFLPDYLMDHFEDALKSKERVPLVKEARIVYEAPGLTYTSLKFISPFVVFLLIALVILWFSVRQLQRRNPKIKLDYWVYGLNGFMGIVIAWFTLFSEHPAMSPNYNLLWASPLNLAFAFALRIKKWRPRLKYYHIFISIWMVVFLCASPFIPQYFHPVFYLFVIMILSRSIVHSLLIIRKVY